MQMPLQPAIDGECETNGLIKKQQTTFAVGTAEPEVAADVVKVDVRADHSVRQVLLVDVVCHEVAIVRDAGASVDQHDLVDAEDHVQEWVLTVGIVFHHQPAVQTLVRPQAGRIANSVPGVVRQLLSAVRRTAVARHFELREENTRKLS
jgi:hypothetical protein